LAPKVVLVTGGSGLVGSAISSFISSRGSVPNETWYFASSKDADLTVRPEVEALFARVKPTHVLHLAAKVGGLFANLSMKVEFYRQNVLMNDNVMECCRLAGVSKLVSFLSTCIFPDKTTYPIDETMLHLGPPHPSNEGYAYAKRMVDTMNRAYAEEYGCNFTAVIPTNVYGPNDNFDVNGGHVVPGLIHKCYVAKRDKAPFVIWGSGKPLRQFIYSADLAELTVWVLDNYSSPNPVILSVDPDAEVSIADVALLVAKAMDFDGEVVFDGSKADGQFRKTADNAKLRTLRPDFKFETIETGIKKAVDWFLANYDTCRK
jgi:GDP-L-fucose synthase